MRSISKALEISIKPTHLTSNQPNAETFALTSGVGQVRPIVASLEREP